MTQSIIGFSTLLSRQSALIIIPSCPSDTSLVSSIRSVSGCQKVAISRLPTQFVRLHPGHWLLERGSLGTAGHVAEEAREQGEGQDGAVHEALEGDQAGDLQPDHSQDSALHGGKIGLCQNAMFTSILLNWSDRVTTCKVNVFSSSTKLSQFICV